MLVTLLQEADAEAMRLHLGLGRPRDIIAALTRYRELHVFGADTSLTATGENRPEVLSHQLSADYALSETVSTTPDRVRLRALVEGLRKAGRHTEGANLVARVEPIVRHSQVLSAFLGWRSSQ